MAALTYWKEWQGAGGEGGRKRNIQPWLGERNDKNLKEVVPAGGILEVERCTNVQQKKGK